jgi:hypothetical protein
MLAENEILMRSYLDEKKRLEYQIMRDNRKNMGTQMMIEKMYGIPDPNSTDNANPRPQYKFEVLAKKYPKFLGDRNAMRNFHWRDAILNRSSTLVQNASSQNASGVNKSGTV